MIRVVIDSSSDYRVKEAHEQGFDLIPMNVAFGDELYGEDENSNSDTFYELLSESKVPVRTSQPAPSQFYEVFLDAKEKGDEVICLTVSKELSGTYQSANIAKEMVEYDHIHIIDTKAVTICIKVLADKAMEMAKAGCGVDEIIATIESLIPRIKAYAMVDTLDYLAKGGRIPLAAAKLGNMASFKPVITLSKEGKIDIVGKCLGKVKAFNYMLKCLEKDNVDETYPLYPVYTYGKEAALKFEEKLKNNGYQVSEMQQIGAIIGAHGGPGAVGIIYVVK